MFRAHFLRGKQIQKSKSGGGKHIEEFEPYLPVQKVYFDFDGKFEKFIIHVNIGDSGKIKENF